MTRPQWLDQLASWKAALLAKGADVTTYDIGPPATVEELADITRASGRPLPQALGSTLATVSGRVAFFWQLDLRGHDPAPSEQLARFGQIGELAFDVQAITWLRAAGEVTDDDRYLAADQVDLLRASVEFYRTAGGDILAMDARSGAVNYLTYDSGFGDATFLAHSFTDFLERFTAIGCVGPEMWVLELVLGPQGIDPDAALARQWRAWADPSHQWRVI